MSKFDMPKTGTWEQRGGWVVRRLVTDLGLTLEQAAGLVGNLGYESREFKAMQEEKPMVPGSRGGYGWAQWTASRRVNFENWVRARGLAANTDEANYGFLLHELKGSYKYFTDRLRDAGTVAEASRLTHVEYETPADVLNKTYRSGPARQMAAVRALNGALEIEQEPPPEPPVKLVKALASLGRAVKKAQKELTNFGFDTGPVDGDWGKRSREAWLAYRNAYPEKEKSS
jgi:hypothetical protein